jgi:hypothetical protein
MRLHSDDFETAENTEPREPRELARRPQSFRERHALKGLGLALVAAFVTVIFAQVAC